MTEPTVPYCAECEKIIWPNQTPRFFVWSASEDDPPPEESIRGAVTHEDCAENFAKRLKDMQA